MPCKKWKQKSAGVKRRRAKGSPNVEERGAIGHEGHAFANVNLANKALGHPKALTKSHKKILAYKALEHLKALTKRHKKSEPIRPSGTPNPSQRGTLL
ncbi:uncharacterized protein G2W53_041193 [Senna tora]|uniref:Uncharacterized protein n=1 Tax=Senna tora TaxID=362788 RepID=A0A834SJJ4_9FABA|nr:uncharacterized protein G2W53_041193 [Senna tora]